MKAGEGLYSVFRCSIKGCLGGDGLGRSGGSWLKSSFLYGMRLHGRGLLGA